MKIRVQELVYGQEICIKCGCVFFIPAVLQDRNKEKLSTFYCPSGHPQAYNSSTTDWLRATIAEKEKALENARGTIADLQSRLSRKRPAKRNT